MLRDAAWTLVTLVRAVPLLARPIPSETSWRCLSLLMRPAPSLGGVGS